MLLGVGLEDPFLCKKLFLCFYFQLHWVFLAACELSRVAAGGSCSLVVGASAVSMGAGRTGSRAQAPVVVMHRLRCPLECGIFPDQGLNL